MFIESQIDEFIDHKIPFDEASHKGVCYTMYNSKFQSIFPISHCKDFFNELWYAHFKKDTPNVVYSYRPKQVELDRIDSVTNILLFTGERNTNTVRNIQPINNKEYVVKYLYAAVERVLGDTNIIKDVVVSERGLLVSVRTYIFKYPTMNSLLTYIFRTALEAGEYEEADVDSLTNILIDEDHVYYTQHLKFKELINTPFLLKNTKRFTWGAFAYKGFVSMNEVNNNPGKKMNLHNYSGFISYTNFLKKYSKEEVNNYLQNTIKRKLK